MTMIDSIREMQTRSLDGMKSAQEQLVSYNERMADTVLGAMPDWDSPFSQYLPKPSEMVDAYYTFLGELYEANKEFASRVAAAWEKPEDSES
ncbi:MAG: hypothetical protein ACFCVK_17325 [Acidimicrobiales bacterium]